VRELKSEVERLAALAENLEIRFSDMSPEIRKAVAGGSDSEKRLRRVPDEEKSRRARNALAATGWIVRKAASALNTTPYALRRMCRRLGVPLEDPSGAKARAPKAGKMNGKAETRER